MRLNESASLYGAHRDTSAQSSVRSLSAQSGHEMRASPAAGAEKCTMAGPTMMLRPLTLGACVNASDQPPHYPGAGEP
jgi:hypothetical protein